MLIWTAIIWRCWWIAGRWWRIMWTSNSRWISWRGRRISKIILSHINHHYTDYGNFCLPRTWQRKICRWINWRTRTVWLIILSTTSIWCVLRGWRIRSIRRWIHWTRRGVCRANSKRWRSRWIFVIANTWCTWSIWWRRCRILWRAWTVRGWSWTVRWRRRTVSM